MFWLLVGGVGELERLALPAPEAAHTVLTSSSGEFAVNGDCAHVGGGSLSACSKVLATAVLPRLVPVLFSCGLLGALAGLAGFLAERRQWYVRGPPRALACVIAGQDLLTRMCIARR
ncbi:putative copper homeostasis (lipo)protein LpqS [Mycobacterium kubicae]